MNLGTSIKVALAKQGKNQTWLADQMNVSTNAVSKICTQNKAGTERLNKICEILGMPLSEFIALGE